MGRWILMAGVAIVVMLALTMVAFSWHYAWLEQREEEGGGYDHHRAGGA